MYWSDLTDAEILAWAQQEISAWAQQEAERIQRKKEEREMRGKVRDVFDLDWIKAFTETNIDHAEWIEVRPGEKRRVLVIETLIDSWHGAYIPGMILDMFGQAEEYDLEDPYNLEKNEWIYDALQDLEDEVNDTLNDLLPSKGIYYMGYHEYDGSYGLFYEEYKEDDMIEVVIIEAGPNYLDKLEAFEMELPEDEDQAVAEAMKAVATLGYTVIPNDRGGCNAYVSESFGEDWIAVTVEPSAEEEEEEEEK